MPLLQRDGDGVDGLSVWANALRWRTKARGAIVGPFEAIGAVVVVDEGGLFVHHGGSRVCQEKIA